ncbi:4Fe-4S dicluster domain-containing protein [Anaerotruncus colihominis]|uniref:4Fe-4S dicluster domain-containing protein n=1 Tax=Anaerotruncus colihominis TaxID=169435 RepID=A0A845SYT5_9FIRM|nr:4Fe-4S dicluster domain-containing protein [Anaerotruncus colihominis]MCR2025067.1 SLBB domain-containing protein [Anaerotruncus colihominis]NDO40088.1 4Fe-4S dicluster domain-containing protein [Anaerotruncus colihominis]
MAGFLYKGILLQQHKEPALSRDLREFLNADTIGVLMDRPAVEDPDALTPDDIIAIARDAHIIDERDGRSLHEKLEGFRAAPARLLVADAIDDEPYISSQLNPMLKNSAQSVSGLRLAQKATGAAKAQFAVYKNLTDLDIRIPRKLGGVRVQRIRGRYPAEYQASMFFAAKEDVAMVGVGALIHLARAVAFNKPQTTTFITVAGDCIGNPTNLEVSLGMTVGQVLERCGLIEDPARVVVGGSMTGFSVMDTDNTLVTPATRAILAFHEDFKSLNIGCIGCSRCAHACPKGLNPFYLYRSIQNRRYGLFRVLDAQMCIGCGTCSYVCPSKLDLSETIQRAAREYRPMIGSMRTASALQAKEKTAEYESYMADYRLHRAQITHRRALKAADRDLRRSQTQAKAAHTAAVAAADGALAEALRRQQATNREIDAALAAAQNARQSQEQTADRALADANRAKLDAEREADRILDAADAARRTAEKQADQRLAEALRARQDAEKEAGRALGAAGAARQGSEKAADQTLAAALRARQDTEKEVDRSVEHARKARDAALREANKAFEAALKAHENAERDAQKALDRVMKQSGATAEARTSAQNALESIKAAGPGRRESAQKARDAARQAAANALKQAEDAAGQAKERAARLYEEAQKQNRSAKVQAQAGLEGAQEQNRIAKIKAEAAYESAQAKNQQEKLDAQGVFEAAREQNRTAKAQALAALESAQERDKQLRVQVIAVYREAEKAAALERAEAQTIYEAAQAVHAKALTQAQADYDARQKAIADNDRDTREKIEQALEDARVEARVYRGEMEDARAAVTGRAVLVPSMRQSPPQDNGASAQGIFADRPDEPVVAAPVQAPQTQLPVEPSTPEQTEPEQADSGPRLDLDIDSLFREAMPPPPLTADMAEDGADDAVAPVLTYEQASGEPEPAAMPEQAGTPDHEDAARMDGADEPALAASGRYSWQKNDEPSAEKGEDDR